MTEVLERLNLASGSSWVGQGGTTTTTKVAAGADGPDAAAYTRVALTADAGGWWRAYTGGTLTPAMAPGQVYTASVWVRASTARQVRLLLRWSTGIEEGAVLTVMTAGQWQRLSLTVTVPAGATGIQWLAANTSVGVAGETLDVSRPLMEQAGEVLPYFDGSTPPPASADKRWAASWTGAAGASTSVARVVDRVSPDLSGAPRALVVFGTLQAGTATLTIYRTVEGRTMEVRGGVNLAAGEPFAMDYEVAQGVRNSWRAEMFTADGSSLGFTEPLSADIPDTGLSWLQSPLRPETALPVRVAIKTIEEVARPVQSEAVWPEGSYVARMLGGGRRGVSGLPVRIYVEREDLAAVDAMLGTHEEHLPPVLLLRTAPPWRLPRVFFMGITDVREFTAGMYALAGFEYVVSEAHPPFPGLVRPLLRRKDIDAAYPTRAARAAAYRTRLERDTDYSLAGVAG